MALHRNADDFSVFLKWVNSGTEIYLNIPRFLKRVEIFKEGTLPAVMQGGSIPSSISPQLALDSERATVVAHIRRGLQRAQQFGMAGGIPRLLPKWRNWRRRPMRKTKYG